MYVESLLGSVFGIKAFESEESRTRNREKLNCDSVASKIFTIVGRALKVKWALELCQVMARQLVLLSSINQSWDEGRSLEKSRVWGKVATLSEGNFQ